MIGARPSSGAPIQFGRPGKRAGPPDGDSHPASLSRRASSGLSQAGGDREPWFEGRTGRTAKVRQARRRAWGSVAATMRGRCRRHPPVRIRRCWPTGHAAGPPRSADPQSPSRPKTRIRRIRYGAADTRQTTHDGTSRPARARPASEPASSRHGVRVRVGTGAPARCLPHRVFLTAIGPGDHRIERTLVAAGRRRYRTLDAGDQHNTERHEPGESDPRPVG